jgi:WD40 repeat protein
LYEWDGSKLIPKSGKLESNRGAVSALAFSPDGSLLAAGDVRFYSHGSEREVLADNTT